MEKEIFVDNINDCVRIVEILIRNNYNVEIDIKFRKSELSCMRTQEGYNVKYKEMERK